MFLCIIHFELKVPQNRIWLTVGYGLSLWYCCDKLDPTCHQDLENGAVLQNIKVQMQDKNKNNDKCPLVYLLTTQHPYTFFFHTYIYEVKMPQESLDSLLHIMAHTINYV